LQDIGIYENINQAAKCKQENNIVLLNNYKINKTKTSRLKPGC